MGHRTSNLEFEQISLNEAVYDEGCLMKSIAAGICLFLGLVLPILSYGADDPAPELVEVATLVNGSRPLGEMLVYAADPTGSINIAEILGNRRILDWQHSDVATPNFGISPPAYWFSIALANTSSGTVQRLLQMDHPLTDYLDFYLVQNGQVIETVETGDARPLKSRPWEHRTFLFPIELAAGEQVEVFIRAETEGSLAAPIVLWDVKDFFEHDQHRLTLQILFVGVMAALSIYNLFLLLATRDWSYLWYTMSMVTISVVVLSFLGITAQFVWADFPQFNNLTSIMATGANVFFAALFAYSFLNLSRYGYFIRGFFIIAAAAGVLLFIVNPFLLYTTAVRLTALVATSASLGAIFIGVYLWYKGEILARFYTIAWFLLLSGSVLIVLSKFGVLPHNLFLEHAQQMGAVAEGLLLSFALAYRMNLERKRRYQAQAQVLQVQQEANKELEQRVKERTQELEVANGKLIEANAVDGLTKVKNRRFFDEMLAQEWSKNARGPAEMSLLMIDGDHFKRINDTYGHLCGDACLQHLAKIYQGAVNRAGDFVARYGGEEFTILLCFTNSQGAAVVAERLRQQVAETPLEWEGQQIQFTVSIGVSSCIPQPFSDMSTLIKEADDALYAAKHAGRNCVRVFDKGRTTKLIDDSDVNSATQ